MFSYSISPYGPYPLGYEFINSLVEVDLKNRGKTQLDFFDSPVGKFCLDDDFFALLQNILKSHRPAITHINFPYIYSNPDLYYDGKNEVFGSGPSNSFEEKETNEKIEKLANVLQQYPSVTGLKLSGNRLNDNDIERLVNLLANTKVQHLDISNNYIGDKGIAALAKGKFLALNIDNIAQPCHLDYLLGDTLLRNLEVTVKSDDAKSLEALASSTSLQSLKLHQYEDFFDLAVIAPIIQRNQNLTHLDLSYLGHFTDTHTAELWAHALASNTTLQILNVSNTEMEDGVGRILFRNMHIKYLDVSFNKLTNETVKVIVGVTTGLEYLNLSFNRVDNNTAMIIAENHDHLPFLRYLSLERSRDMVFKSINDEGVVALAKELGQLETLNLANHSAIGVRGCVELARMPNLQALDLYGISVCGAVASFAESPSLQYLNILSDEPPERADAIEQKLPKKEDIEQLSKSVSLMAVLADRLRFPDECRSHKLIKTLKRHTPEQNTIWAGLTVLMVCERAVASTPLKRIKNSILDLIPQFILSFFGPKTAELLPHAKSTPVPALPSRVSPPFSNSLSSSLGAFLPAPATNTNPRVSTDSVFSFLDYGLC